MYVCVMLQLLRLVVDHCMSAQITETIDASSADRSSCEATASVDGEHYLLNVVTPLELGGMSSPGVNGMPSNNAFSGCIKNMRVNDKVCAWRAGVRVVGAFVHVCPIMSPHPSQHVTLHYVCCSFTT